MKRQLSQLQRLLVAGIYIVIIVMIYGLLNGGIADLLNQSEPTSVWFFSGILLIIMGMYVTEPYFSSPTDTLSNSISLILVLTSLTNRQELKGYVGLLIYAVCMFMLSIFHMIIKNHKAPFIEGVAAGTVKHPQATFDYSFLVVKVDYICHGFHRSNSESLQLICY